MAQILYCERKSTSLPHAIPCFTRFTLFFPSDRARTHTHTHTHTHTQNSASIRKLPQATMQATTLKGSHVQLRSDLPYLPTAASKRHISYKQKHTSKLQATQHSSLGETRNKMTLCAETDACSRVCEFNSVFLF
jgi:hypothetical protein